MITHEFALVVVAIGWAYVACLVGFRFVNNRLRRRSR